MVGGRIEQDERSRRAGHHERGDLLPQNRRKSSNHERSVGGLLLARFTELATDRRERGGPLHRLEALGRRVEALQRDGAIRSARGHVKLANQLRIPRRRLPAIVARGEARGQALGPWRDADSDGRLELEQHVGERQLAIEILGVGVGARAQRRRQALALGVADASEPAVLQRREYRDQHEHGGRHGEHRRPEAARHATSLARTFPSKTAPNCKFYVLNKLFAPA